MSNQGMDQNFAIEPLLDHLARLHARVMALESRPAVLVEALEGLDQAVEEVHTCVEELQARGEELDLERRRYQELFDHSPEAHLVTGATPAIVAANQAAGRLLDVPAAELVGQPVTAVLACGGRMDALVHAMRARRMGAGEIIADAGAGRFQRRRLVRVRYRAVPDPSTRDQRVHWLLEDLEPPVFEAESAGADDPRRIRRWLGLYGHLVLAADAALVELLEHADSLAPEHRQAFEAAHVRPQEAVLVRLRRRLRHWRQRHAEIVRLDLDAGTGWLSHDGRSVRLTRRERQLMDFLLAHPDRFFSPVALMLQAWHATYLNEAQLRGYVGRLRRRLEDLRAPCRLTNRRAAGYALMFDEGEVALHPVPAGGGAEGEKGGRMVVSTRL